MKNFFKSVWFNVVLAVLAGFCSVMQEVWIGGDTPKLNMFILAIIASVCFSACAEVGKVLYKFKWNNNHFAIGAGSGILIAGICLIFI